MNIEHYKRQLESLKSRLEKQMELLSKRGSEPLKESIGELSGTITIRQIWVPKPLRDQRIWV